MYNLTGVDIMMLTGSILKMKEWVSSSGLMPSTPSSNEGLACKKWGHDM